MKKVKGFTLVELVIVIALIGILATVGIPNMFQRIQQSKHDSAQSQARSIFNSAQTIVQKYEALDRAIINGNKFLKKGIHESGKNIHYFGNVNSSEIKTKIDAEKNYEKNKVGTEFYEKLRAMNNRVTGCKWVVIVEDYKVTHVLCAEDEDDRYVGVYCGCGRHNDYESYKDDTTSNISDVFAYIEKP